MLEFTLPLIHASGSLDDALSATKKAGRSGFVLEVTPNDYRLVDIRDAEAAKATSLSLGEVHGEPIMGPGEIPHLRRATTDPDFRDELIERGHLLAMIRQSGTNAVIFSASERLAAIYAGGTPGHRCQRPNKPAGTPNTRWYHYFPPYSATSGGTCPIDGSPIK